MLYEVFCKQYEVCRGMLLLKKNKKLLVNNKEKLDFGFLAVISFACLELLILHMDE